MGRVSPPFSLVQNRTDDFGASFAHLRRSALQPSPQCTATAPAVHCNHPCSALHPPGPYLVYFKRKYMRPPRITFATADANVINRSRKRYKPLPQTFAGKGAPFRIPSPMVFLMSRHIIIKSPLMVLPDRVYHIQFIAYMLLLIIILLTLYPFPDLLGSFNVILITESRCRILVF